MRHHFTRRPSLCLFFIFAITSISYSQKLDYKAYIFPEVDYKTLLLSENLTLNNNTTAADQSTRFNNNLSLGFNRYSNQGIKQHFSAGRFASFIHTNKTANVFNTYLSSNQRSRNYGVKEQFFEYGYDAYASHSLRAKSDKYNSLYSGVDIILKIGKGRIDVLNEVMLAEFIIDDLRNDGLLTDTLNQEVIFAFAGEIAKYNFTRILDSRNYRVQVIKGLSMWIKNNFPVKDNSDIELTTILIDNFSYANTGFRTEGFRISIGIEPNISYSRSFQAKQNFTNYGGDLILEYSHQKPISRYLQSNYYGILRLGLNRYETDNPLTSPASTSERINSSVLIAHKLGFYPNSRTNIDITTLINYQYNKTVYEEGGILDTESSNITPKIRAQASYFIDYRLRLFATFEILYYYRFNNDESPFVYEDDYVPDDYSYPLTDWYIGRYSDPSLLDLNSIHTRSFHNKVTYAFNAGFTFSIF